MIPEEMSDATARVLSITLTALKVTSSDLRPATSGLPAGATAIPSANLIVAATPCSRPMFTDVLVKACRIHRADIMLIRCGLFPETMNPVDVDLALTGPDGPLVVSEMAFFRGPGRDLWLVPPREGPYAQIGPDGLLLDTCPPFRHPSDRIDGLCLAAAEIVRAARFGGR